VPHLWLNSFVNAPIEPTVSLSAIFTYPPKALGFTLLAVPLHLPFRTILAGRSHLVLLACLIVVLGTWGFIHLADEVKEGETQRFDERIVHALQRPAPADAPSAIPPTIPIGPHWLREVGRDLSALGSVIVLGLVTAAVAGYLLITGKHRAMWLVLIATVGGLLLSSALKWIVDRPRPGVSHFAYVYTTSFPSGHSMLSAVVYLTLGSLLAQLTARRPVKLYFLAIALLLTFLIGASRVYMGVHYPTDVLAGWTAGLVWALLCWLAARYLQRRGAIEQEETQKKPADQSSESASPATPNP
jgi:undecaprenyl-diphosphatase